MSTMRGTFFICVTILVSVFGITFYGYQQDQFVISSNSNYVAIFDRKSKTMNICNGANCTLITPRFPNLDYFPIGTEKGSFLSRLFGEKGESGQRLLGSFPQSQQAQPVNAQVGQPQMAGGNPQISPQAMQQMQQQQQIQQQQMQQQQMLQQQQMQQQQIQQQQMLQQQMQQQQMQQQAGEQAPKETEAPAEDTDNAKEDEATTDEGDEEAAPV